MHVEYFAQWNWSDHRGLQPLSEKRVASIHKKGQTYIAYLPDDRLALTLRPENHFVDLGFLGSSLERLGGASLLLGANARVEAIDVWGHDEEIVRLQSDDPGSLSVWTAPFREPASFEAKPPPSVSFPELGHYSELAKLSRDPWSYVVLPEGFDPPRP